MKVLPKNNHSTAVDSIMKPVLEEGSDEDFSDEEEGRQSSTGIPNSTEEETSESFQLGERETAMVKRSKALVILVILLVTAGVSTLTLLYVREEENKDYESRVSEVWH